VSGHELFDTTDNLLGMLGLQDAVASTHHHVGRAMWVETTGGGATVLAGGVGGLIAEKLIPGGTEKAVHNPRRKACALENFAKHLATESKLRLRLNVQP
jgi:hypothetical protein